MISGTGMLELRVDLGSEPGEDPSELDEATRQLQRELLELDVQDVRQVADGSAPPGTRGIGVAVVSSLAVSAGQEAIGAVVRTLVQWMSRRRARSVKLTIGEDSLELSDVSAEDQRRLVESFLARHAAAG
jgi:hypothetical protein